MKTQLIRLSLAIIVLALCSCAARQDFEPKCGSPNSPLGSHFVPDRIFGANFTPACSAHDDCYDTVGSLKEDCDAQFKRDLIAAVKETGPLPRIPARLSAEIYHLAVKMGGKNAYEEAQKAAKAKAVP